MSEKRKSTLRDWELISHGDWYSLRGVVFNDDRFPDGHHVLTSMVERIDFVKGVAETRNTVYELF